MEDFVSFEMTKTLKEKGFILEKTEIYGKFDNDGLFHSQLYFNYFETMDCDEIIAPTISQVLKWLREEKEFMVFPVYSTNTSRWYCSIVNADSLDTYKLSLSDSYEEAALAGIEYVLDNLI